MLKGLKNYLSGRSAKKTALPRVLSRSEHPVSRSEISEGALKVLYRLHQAGFKAYLVGGCIRDRLLGKKPKDFDVATDATPEQVNGLFRNARIIGRRFRIVHVRFGRDIIEVTTFRGQSDQTDNPHHQQSDAGMLLRDNVWGNIEDDAARRDFTINALYYNIADFCLYDYTGGLDDLQHRRLRLIGDPAVRYREDPVRMLRALRFAAKLDFTLERKTLAAIKPQRQLLLQIPPARLFDEVLKLFLYGAAEKTLLLLQQHGLFEFLFPATAEALQTQTSYQQLLVQGMINTDERIRQERPVTPAFLYAVLLWPGLDHARQQLERQGLPPFPAMQQAGNQLMQRQVQHVSLPKHFSLAMREIWEFQLKLPKRHGQRAWQLLQEPRFRAAYDFLLLREASGEPTEALGNWWTTFQQASQHQQEQLVKSLGKGAAAPRSRRRKPRTRKPVQAG